MNQKVSIILPCRNESIFVQKTVDTILEHTIYGNYEIIVVDDSSVDGSIEFVKSESKYSNVQLLTDFSHRLGVSVARDKGAKFASGEVLVFMDAHCLTPLNWLTRCIKKLSDIEYKGIIIPSIAEFDRDVAVNEDLWLVKGRGYGVTWDSNLNFNWIKKATLSIKYGIYKDCLITPAFPGMFLVMTKDLYEAIGGFDTHLLRWGLENIDMSIRLWCMGYGCYVYDELIVGHGFKKEFKYEVSDVDLIYNKLRVAKINFSERNYNIVKKNLSQIGGENYKEALKLIDKNIDNINKRKNFIERRCIYNDEWYLNKFCIKMRQVPLQLGTSVELFHRSGRYCTGRN